MPTLLARNAEVLVTMDGSRHKLKGAGLFTRDGIIEQVGATAELPDTADLVLDLSGQIVLPGFVNTHHHLDQTLTRNLPAAQNNNLFPWLKVHYRLWAAPHARGDALVDAGWPRRAGGIRLHDSLRSLVCLSKRLPRRRPDRRGAGNRCPLPRLPRLDVARRVARRSAAGRLRRG